jgi:hypothetical protein
MHFTSVSTAIALASSLVQKQAYFLVASHITGLGGPVGQSGNSWLMSPTLECSDLTNQNTVNERPDVSGDKDGVRVKCGARGCKKTTCLRDECPVEVGQHFPEVHRSKSKACLLVCVRTNGCLAWYADGGGDMLSLEGRVVGNCVGNLDTD